MQKLVFVALIAFIISFVSSHCVHDDLIKQNPPQHIVAESITYPEKVLKRDAHGRMVEEDIYEPLRVYFYTDQLERDLANNAAKLVFLRDNVFPKAAERFANLLNVVRVQGNLKLDRPCYSFYVDTANEKRQCSSHTNVTCGDFGPIPDDHYASQPIYSSANTISGYTTGGNGVASTDIIIYVSAKQTATCTSSTATLAYAAYCVQDVKDRPVAGYVNFCQDNVDTADETKAVVTTLHEVGHVLAYSSSLYSFFRKDDGSAYTKRRLGTTGAYTLDHGTPNPTISEETMKSYTERGNTVNKLTLPKAVAAAREHFNCDGLNGVELENQGGSGTQTSHPEMRIYFNDFMNGQYPAFPVVSKTTLAVFESSGWYKPNYDNAEFHSWGYKQGCDFATEKCIVDSQGQGASHFCTSGPTQQVRCTQNLLGFGLCSTTSFNADLPAQYQYFSGQPRYGGSTQLMDYCPIYDTFNWSGGLYPAGQSLCTNPNGGPSQNQRGEKYGSTSRCAVNTLLSNSFSGSENGMYGGCFQFDCQTSGVKILVGDTFVTCGVNDEGKSKTVSGYKGVIYCPDFKIACPNPVACTKDCGDHGSCVSNVCVCVSGWDGELCDKQRNSASLYGLSLVAVIAAIALQMLLF